MDDVNGKELAPALVRRGREQEMAYIHNKKVGTVMKRDEAHREMKYITNTVDRHQQRGSRKAFLQEQVCGQGVQRQCGRWTVCCNAASWSPNGRQELLTTRRVLREFHASTETVEASPFKMLGCTAMITCPLVDDPSGRFVHAESAAVSQTKEDGTDTINHRDPASTWRRA